MANAIGICWGYRPTSPPASRPPRRLRGRAPAPDAPRVVDGGGARLRPGRHAAAPLRRPLREAEALRLTDTVSLPTLLRRYPRRPGVPVLREALANLSAG